MPTYTEQLSQQINGLREIGFYIVIITLLVLFVSFLSDTLAILVTAWFDTDPGIHYLHELAFVALLWTVLIGILVQLYKPEHQVGAIQQALLVTIIITSANILTGFFFPPALLLGGLLVVAGILHPARQNILRGQTAGRTSRLLLGLLMLAGIPLAVYAANQYALQATGDVHAQLGHYADMITYTGTILLLGLLASAKPHGWRIPLWSAAGLAIILGLSSLLHPTLASSTGVIWGTLTVLWGVGFIVAGEVSDHRDI